jgi:hypothetical protein
MKSNYFYGGLLGLVSGAFMLALPCSAQDLVYETTQANAIARAKAEGKMILTEFGRPTCSDCLAMRTRFNLLSPALKQWILASCVLWESDIDLSSEYVPYASGLGAFSLPLMCFVDPAKPGAFTARYNGLIGAPTFFGDIKAQALKNLPVVVTSLPGIPLTNLVNGSFTVTGVAQTNAALSGSISNASITAVMWRLNGTGPFQTATGTNVWSAPVTLPHGTNIFESYVQYAGSKNSWTNRVILINLGSGGTSLLSQTITFNTLAPQTYGDGSITLSSIGGGSASPVIFTNTGPATISGSVLTITGAGLVTVTANQAGDATYSAAPPASQSFMVNKATPVVIATGGNFTFDGTAEAGSGTATGGAGEALAVTLSYIGTGSTSYGPTAIAPSAVGTYTVTAHTVGDANNAPGSSLAVALTINSSSSIVNLAALTNFLGNGIVDQADLNAVLARYWAQSPPYITNSTFPGRTNFCFNITNFVFTVQVSTNLQNWANLNSQARICFTDTNAVSGPARYYRLAASTNASF